MLSQSKVDKNLPPTHTHATTATSETAESAAVDNLVLASFRIEQLSQLLPGWNHLYRMISLDWVLWSMHTSFVQDWKTNDVIKSATARWVWQ